MASPVPIVSCAPAVSPAVCGRRDHAYREGNQVADTLCHEAYKTPLTARLRTAGSAMVPFPVWEKLEDDRCGVVHQRLWPQQHHHGQKSSTSNPAAAGYFLPRTVLTWLAAACLSLALLHLLCCSPRGAYQAAVFSPLLQYFNGTYSSYTSSGNREAGGEVAAGGVENSSCDYSQGKWVWAPGHARRYNGTACNVKPEQDCLRNGRPETGYLDWRWQPASCSLPPFDAAAFLDAARGKHVAFVGDSMARNQAESLLCLLGASFPYDLVDHDAEGHYKRQFTRWAFPSHGVTLSTYWAPYLVRARGKPYNYSEPHNLVYLDELGDRWDADAGGMDVVVLTAGHWFWNPAVYHRNNEVVGVHATPELNKTEIGFTSPYREAFRRALERLASDGRRRTVVLGTFAPPHFEGKPIFDPTACTKTEPYKEGEKELGSIEKEMRTILFEEAAAAAERDVAGGGVMRLEVQDVTRLASMRPDGHPGPYMHRDPFAHGVPERMQVDCLHSCLPGPVDTFNEILLQILSRQRIFHFGYSNKNKSPSLHHTAMAAEAEAEAAEQSRSFFPNKLVTVSCALSALFTLSLIYFYSPPLIISSANLLTKFQPRGRTTNPPTRPVQAVWKQCDYSDGKWVWDDANGGDSGPRYDSENCDMKMTYKCVINGKPDGGYLHWRWKPSGCNLPALDPSAFLRLVRGKRLAFVGDSTARNQAEALVCHLATAARPVTVVRDEERLGRKFWRWSFPAPHDVNISTYWSPFLVRSEGHSEDYGMEHEVVILDAFTEPWTADLDAMDVMVISAGHWFPHKAIYYENGEIVGVHNHPELNRTEMSGVSVYRKVMQRTLEHVNAAVSNTDKDKLVVVETIAPAHFDSKYSWNHRDACSRPKPFGDGETEIASTEAELRKIVVEEVAVAEARRRRRGLRFEVLDVTRLAAMRPDAHPGVYIFKHAYAGGPVPETAPNDCLHWCAPGPVDTTEPIQ
uniref:Trichome birefringence-like N-terminal domain-containing protein n=1 Tax=Leersia perrieri TaxID=77586 RepID=A0A0D9WNP3_9ORYZ